MSNEKKAVVIPRTLLIGLGGSGGEVLSLLYEMLTEEQKLKAKTLYLDTDNKDLKRLRKMGVRSVALGTSDTVANMAAYLGDEDGVYDWLPNDEENESVFLSSPTDTGASQYRYKSRLCLARFLRNRDNALNEILDSMNVPGAGIRTSPLRVIITSSIAGGTGAGSFIQVALYIRKYFRDNGQNNVQIMGLFGCPDLFSAVAENDQERENMFANAYAAVRELNAMNLAVCGSNELVGDYAKAIKIKIDTESEGRLFDSKGKEFQCNYSAKPFDNIYFIDKNNAYGAVLRSLEQYYQTMADIAYTRLFSVMEETVRSGENNELQNHAKIPTAIYGSAGYSRVRYPYEDILRYLAERKTLNDLDHKWSYLDSEWKQYSQTQQDAALARGRVWKPTDAERESKFVESMRNLMNKNSNTDFLEFAPMVGITKGGDRASEYERALRKAMASGGGSTGGEKADGLYSLCSLPEVAKARQAAKGCGVNVTNGDGEEEQESYREQLQSVASDAVSKLTVLADRLHEAVDRQVSVVINTILPITDEGRAMAKTSRSELNLFDGLLSEGGKAVHPLAARYLLYRLRGIVREYLDAKKQRDKCEDAMGKKIKNLNLAFDDDKDDGEDITVSRYVAEELKLGTKLGKYAFWMENRARDDLDEFKLAIGETVSNIISAADAELRYQVYEILLERLNGLIRQYEGLFDNVHHFRSNLREAVERDLMLHTDSDDRCVFVGASPEMKRYYYSVDSGVRSALAAASAGACAKAGEVVFDSLLDRYLKQVAQDRAAARMSYDEEEAAQYDEDYSGMSEVFDGIVKAYQDYLRANVPSLKNTVVGALIAQCCEENNIKRDKIYTDASAREEFSDAFIGMMKDVVDKSAPMLRYNTNNSDRYFNAEKVGDHSKPYKMMGMDSVCAAELAKVFPGEGGSSPLDTLQQKLGLTNKPVVSDAFTSSEIFCFSAIHCLQPTQIQKFNEDYEKSYYVEYRTHLAEAMRGERLSETGHLDKSWHLRGAMPYISRKLEMEWRDDLMKAFVYAMRRNRIIFTVDADNRRCFKFNGKFVHYPKGRLVLTNQISQLIEYLAEMELEVPKLAKKLDEDIDFHISKLSGRTGSLSVYKAGMTTDSLLVELRKNLLEYEACESLAMAGHGANFHAEGDFCADDSDCENIRGLRSEIISGEADKEVEIRLDRTLGGLLEIAWKVHQSEENLGQDRNYGEALLRCGAYILERFCQNMYGEGWVMQKDTPEYQEYMNLYNHAAQKMVEEFVVVIARQYKLTREQLHNAIGRNEPSEDYPKLRIPAAITATREYKWLAENWKLKHGN